MGEVYRARDSRLSREVALKVLPAEVSADRDRIARFEQEARAASALNHPNIVTVYEIGQSEGTSFIAMELVEGKTLRELIVAGPLAFRRVISIAAQAAEGLAKAHGSGIVHRDLKPENLMVSKDGYVKILDFGLSKLAAPESGEVSAMPTLARPETHPGTVLGTVAYMSPEQASGEPVDYRSDQFSLGSILYEALTGEKAFSKKTAAETMSAIIRGEPELLGKQRPDVPPPLRWIVERCLAKDPEERYTSTRDLARDLAGVRDHISEVTSGTQAAAEAPARGKGRLWLAAAGAALLALGALAHALIAGRAGGRSAAAPVFRRLTFRNGEIQNARFSPDGQTVFYGATWEGEIPRLYSTRPGSPESAAFDFGSDRADILSVSPSGELAILVNQNLGGGVLARVPMAGGIPRRVLEDVFYASGDWAPDGKDLVVSHHVGNLRKLEYPPGHSIGAPNDALAPRFSPDGKLIAFFEWIGTNAVTVIEPSGKNRRVLSDGWASLSGAPGWSADGKEIWFTGARSAGEPEAIYGVTLAGKVRLIIRVPGILELDDVFRDGRILAAHHVIVRGIYGRSAADPKERSLAWLDVSDPGDLSDDGKTLLLTEMGEGSGQKPAVYLRGMDGSPAVKLGDGLGMAISPDGKSVLALAGEPGKPQRFVLLPTGTGQPRTLSGEDFSDYSGAGFFPDGKRIAFAASKLSRPWQMYVQNLDGGPPRPLGPEGPRYRGGLRSVSPDGKWIIAFQRPGKSVLLSAESGQARPIAGFEPLDVPVAWSADGKEILVRESAARLVGGRIRIWRLNPDNGERRLVTEIQPSDRFAPGQRVLVTPDAKAYVYPTMRALSQLYLIEGLR